MRYPLFVFCLLAGFVASAEDNKPRVFVTDSQSWEVRGNSGGSSAGFGGSASGGARPQTAEIIKTFGERCPSAIVTNKQQRADYVVVLDHEGGKGWLRKDNKVAVFNWEGDSIVSHSTMSLGGSVQDACKAITVDWEKNSGKRAASLNGESGAAQAVSPKEAKIKMTSTPSGADIEVDGGFVGNTPSEITLTAGDHNVSIRKSGFKPWERKIKVTGGDISLNAELERIQ